MSTCIEFEGKNLEIAIKKACEKLNVKEEKLEHEVVSYGSSGIFGIVGAKKARIRVFLPENSPDTSPASPEIQPDRPQHNPPLSEELTLGEAEAFGKGVVQKLLGYLAPDATLQVEKKNNRVVYRISSENSAVLIGKKGQTLDAIQFIVEKIIAQNFRTRENENRIRIQIDVEGYLDKRKENLMNLAGRLASKVKKTGKPVTVGHMTSHDRRIIHVALKSDGNVRTQSLGDGILKKLVIFPKKLQPKKLQPSKKSQS